MDAQVILGLPREVWLQGILPHLNRLSIRFLSVVCRAFAGLIAEGYHTHGGAIYDLDGVLRDKHHYIDDILQDEQRALILLRRLLEGHPDDISKPWSNRLILGRTVIIYWHQPAMVRETYNLITEVNARDTKLAITWCLVRCIIDLIDDNYGYRKHLLGRGAYLPKPNVLDYLGDLLPFSMQGGRPAKGVGPWHKNCGRGIGWLESSFVARTSKHVADIVYAMFICNTDADFDADLLANNFTKELTHQIITATPYGAPSIAIVPQQQGKCLRIMNRFSEFTLSLVFRACKRFHRHSKHSRAALKYLLQNYALHNTKTSYEDADDDEFENGDEVMSAIMEFEDYSLLMYVKHIIWPDGCVVCFRGRYHDVRDYAPLILLELYRRQPICCAKCSAKIMRKSTTEHREWWEALRATLLLGTGELAPGHVVPSPPYWETG